MDRIKERIEQLKAQQQELITQANLQIVKLSGAIEALEELVAPKEGASDESAPADS
jgi:hypothetical protein